jgi:hypothetical protein
MPQSLPPRVEERGEQLAQASGFLLHAGVAIEAEQRSNLEAVPPQARVDCRP